MNQTEFFHAHHVTQIFTDSIRAGRLSPVVPTGATASYNGVFLKSVVRPENPTFPSHPELSQTRIAGRYSMIANFSNNTVTGSLGDFANYAIYGSTQFDDIEGSLPLSNGTITGLQVSADANGTLTDSAGSFTVNSNIKGEFFDDKGSSLFVGDLVGTRTRTGTGNTSDFNGQIFARE